MSSIRILTPVNVSTSSRVTPSLVPLRPCPPLSTAVCHLPGASMMMEVSSSRFLGVMVFIWGLGLTPVAFKYMKHFQVPGDVRPCACAFALQLAFRIWGLVWARGPDTGQPVSCYTHPSPSAREIGRDRWDTPGTSSTPLLTDLQAAEHGHRHPRGHHWASVSGIWDPECERRRGRGHSPVPGAMVLPTGRGRGLRLPWVGLPGWVLQGGWNPQAPGYRMAYPEPPIPLPIARAGTRHRAAVIGRLSGPAPPPPAMPIRPPALKGSSPLAVTPSPSSSPHPHSPRLAPCAPLPLCSGGLAGLGPSRLHCSSVTCSMSSPCPTRRPCGTPCGVPSPPSPPSRSAGRSCHTPRSMSYVVAQGLGQGSGVGVQCYQ